MALKKGICVVLGLLVILCCLDYGVAGNSKLADEESKMGMDVLYKMVHVFLGDIIQPKNISESFLNLSTVFVDNKFDEDQLNDWKEWADYGKGYAAGAIIGILFIVAMPIVGLVFCCCRLCGRCGGERTLHDSRNSKCKRRTYCTLVVVFNTLALAGVICSFMCSHLIHTALKNEDDKGTIGHIRNSLSNIKNFSDDAVTNVSSTVTHAFETIADKAIFNITETGITALDNVLASLNASRHLDKARSISRDVNVTKAHLEDVGILVGRLRNDSSDLQQTLNTIKNNIQNVCQTGGNCNGFKPEDYNTNADFSTLGTLQAETQRVASTMDMSRYIQEAEAQIDKAKQDTNASIDRTITKARESIGKIRLKVNDGLNSLRRQKDDAMSFYPSVEEDLREYDEDIKDNYSDYVFYGCIGVSCVYLLIVVIYYMGIVFGLCGERPGHNAPCCNRGTGASYLMGGVAFTFIFSWILMLICTVLFVVGGISYTEVCRYFTGHDPNNFKVFDETLSKGLELSKTLYNNPNIPFSLSKSIRDCQQDRAIYSAFKMDYIVNLDTTIDITPLKQELSNLRNTNLNIPNVTIISSSLEDKLRNFAGAGVDNINFDSYFTELNKTLTKVDLGTLYIIVKNLANQQTDQRNQNTLNAQADRLLDLNNTNVPALKRDVASLRMTVMDLKEQGNITGPILSLIAGLKASQQQFNTRKGDLVKQEINTVADRILGDTNVSVDVLKFDIRNNVGHCKALSDSIYSVSDSACSLLVDPINGLWFSFGWCLFFFVLCLIFSVLLAGEYRHEYKYGKEFDDPFENRHHDMMPLTSRMDC